ncbi:hypothetical protein Q4561_12550 [Alteromonas sp. 1_MG-2023]|uniref:hypothetical protein n=1 Tax=Alteromonas sp. 1_MG-2023 TaxID=3062669 RepID=UPI0026E38AF9|nr:hypothetical protein [Alteromonas sp. 1_MG-2023]MDO6567893.1 hypothetical protein [Alteromonas sp. 1_MG-2023]
MTILIHIGPPKSGTSAIQKWLLSHVEMLRKFGIYYPEHPIDPNGVSSGNVLSIFTRSNEGKLEYSETKKEKLLLDFHKSGCSTLLLSSEFFFLHPEILADAFPSAKFIAYLRYPVEVIESSYNQGVKRHGEVKKLGVPVKPKSFQLKTLERKIKKIGKERFILRPYNDACYTNGTLLGDFSDILKLPVSEFPIDSHHVRVNTSYSIDALEFKRWFNQFPLGELQGALDRFLQSYSAGKEAYSLIPVKVFELYKEEYLNTLKDFCQKYDVYNSDLFIEKCNHLEQKKFRKQQLSDNDFKSLLNDFLQSADSFQILIYYKMVNEWSSNGQLKAPERIKILKRSIPIKIKLKQWLKKNITNGKRTLGLN